MGPHQGLFSFAKITHSFMKTKFKEEFKMLNALVAIVCIFVVLIGASLAIMIMACGQWYADKTTEMTKNTSNGFEKNK